MYLYIYICIYIYMCFKKNWDKFFQSYPSKTALFSVPSATRGSARDVWRTCFPRDVPWNVKIRDNWGKRSNKNMGKYGKIPTKMGIEALKNVDFFFWTFVGIYIYITKLSVVVNPIQYHKPSILEGPHISGKIGDGSLLGLPHCTGLDPFW